MIAIAERKQNIDLAEVVQGAGVEMKSRGGRSVGHCPFHTEKTPSFYVFPDNRFKCFGCGESGDSIDFVQKYHGVDFKTALQILGIDRQNRTITPEIKRQIKQRKHRAALVERFRRWEVEKSNELGLLIRCTYKVMRSWKSIEDLERGGGILHPLPFYEYFMDILCSSDDEAKFQFYKNEATNGELQPC
ncbi:MAG: hypothetical protein HQ552_10945 [Desulfobacteraceae bacterium]|nr:hypothetical protein [Desulfobacteraceae bacterium]